MRAADAYPFPIQNAPLRFIVAVAAVAIVFVLDRSFDALIDDGARFLLLGTAVMASAWFAGTGPALAAIVAGAVIGGVDAREPTEAPAAYTQLALFVVQGLLLTAILSELRRARWTAEEQAEEARRARNDSETASRMKDEFLATVSHELRTPLNAILGWLDLLRTGKLDTQTATRGLESIHRNARLQAQLTGNLLDISKALTGRLHVESHPVSLSEIVRQATIAATPAAQAKGVQIVNDLSERPLAVLGDWNRLRQVVWHLLANALKFTARGGTIGVIVRAERDHARITVYDSGPGIDPEFLPRIFDRFTQEDASVTRVAGGLGVGLALVRELVELHGGEIAAGNRTDRSGAEFTIRLPLQPSDLLERSPERRMPTHVTSAPPLDGVRILVLDPDREERELVHTMLQQRGATVRSTESVEEALEALESWRPDVLLRDNGSPEEASYSLVGKVKSLEADRGGRIPALALTAFGRQDQRVRQMLAAAFAELPKPVESESLAIAVARVTGREHRRAQR